MVNVNENKPLPPSSGEPFTPEQVVQKVVRNALRVHPVPEKAVEEQPELAGKWELEMVGYFRDKDGNPASGGGLMLHTGTEEECKQLYPIARTILLAVGADIASELFALVDRQVGAKKMIGDVAKGIVNPSGHSARCNQCGKIKPCGCISAKRPRP